MGEASRAVEGQRAEREGVRGRARRQSEVSRVVEMAADEGGCADASTSAQGTHEGSDLAAHVRGDVGVADA